MRPRMLAALGLAVVLLGAPTTAQVIDDPPTAEAGADQVISAGQTVYLDGSSSFDDTSASLNLSFSWSFVQRPANSVAILSGDDTPTPSFVADQPGVYIVQLVVADELGQPSLPDLLEVSSLNVAPTADAGEHQSVYVNATVFLDGTGSSDPDMNPLTYAWTMDYLPPGSSAVLTNSSSATPSLTPDVEGEYVMSLVVNDGFVDSPPHLVSVMATSGVDVAANEVRKAFIQARGTPKAEYCQKGHKRTTLATLRDIHRDLLNGKVTVAESGLSRIIQRFDGCSERGTADPKGVGLPNAPDWIMNCTYQVPIYDPMDAGLDALNP